MPAPNKPKTLIKKKMVATRTKIQMSKTNVKRKPKPGAETAPSKPPPAKETGRQPEEVIPQAAPPQAVQEPVAEAPAQKPKALVAKMVRPGKVSQPVPVAPAPEEELSLLQDDYPETPVASVARTPNPDKDPLVKTGIMNAPYKNRCRSINKTMSTMT